MNAIDITLYLNAYRVHALADALGERTAETVEDKLTEAFDIHRYRRTVERHELSCGIPR